MADEVFPRVVLESERPRLRPFEEGDARAGVTPPRPRVPIWRRSPVRGKPIVQLHDELKGNKDIDIDPWAGVLRVSGCG